jgi:hypothetical protein
MTPPFDDVWRALRLPERLARLAPATVPPPTVDALMALPVIARDFIGDLDRNATALAIAMHAAHYAEIAVETWEDTHEQSGVIPAETVLALTNALDAAAWELVMASWEQVEGDDGHD